MCVTLKIYCVERFINKALLSNCAGSLYHDSILYPVVYHDLSDDDDIQSRVVCLQYFGRNNLKKICVRACVRLCDLKIDSRKRHTHAHSGLNHTLRPYTRPYTPTIHQIIAKYASFSVTELKIENCKLYTKLQRNSIHEKNDLKSHNISRDAAKRSYPSIVSN